MNTREVHETVYLTLNGWVLDDGNYWVKKSFTQEIYAASERHGPGPELVKTNRFKTGQAYYLQRKKNRELYP